MQLISSEKQNFEVTPPKYYVFYILEFSPLVIKVGVFLEENRDNFILLLSLDDILYTI